MKKGLSILFIVVLFLFAAPVEIDAQCSICTKTAQQLGEKPAKALNTGILYMAFAPLAIIGFLGYRWWKSNKDMI
jgi:hypothetical protein